MPVEGKQNSPSPVASIHTDVVLGDVEAGNMLWMALSYFQLTSDLPWVEMHYEVFKSWTTFLVDDGLLPANQLSTDDFAGESDLTSVVTVGEN